MGKRKNNFNESLIDNVYTLEQYISILQGIAISMFEWKNVPDSIDTRYIERSLFREGSAIYFNDEVLNEDLCLSMISKGQFDVYGVPVKRMAFSKYNNYQKELNKENSVVIWNNLDRLPSYPIIMSFAYRLYNLDRIIDVNGFERRGWDIECQDQSVINRIFLSFCKKANIEFLTPSQRIQEIRLNLLAILYALNIKSFAGLFDTKDDPTTGRIGESRYCLPHIIRQLILRLFDLEIIPFDVF